jgi:hypothetical protein
MFSLRSSTCEWNETANHVCLVKVKLSLYLPNWALHYEGLWGSGCIDPSFLHLGTSWRWSASRPGRFIPGIHWIVGWVDPRTGLDDVERENSWPYRDLNSDPSAIQPVASSYTDCAIPTVVNWNYVVGNYFWRGPLRRHYKVNKLYFNILLVFIRRWEITIWLTDTRLPLGWYHKVWHTLIRRVEGLYYDTP